MLASQPAGASADALTAAYAEMLDAVRRTAFRIVRDEADAEDIAQQTFLQAWATRGTYDAARGQLQSWLMCIARARALDSRRARVCREARVSAAGAEDGELCDATSSLHAPPPEPSHQLDRSAGDARLHRAMQALSPLARRVIQLAYFEGLTQRQIAVVLSRPLGTVKTISRAALSAIREHLLSTAPAGPGSRPGPLPSLDRPERAFTTELFADGEHAAFQRARRPDPAIAPLRGRCVVCVDDDRHTRVLLHAIFTKAGAQCIACDDVPGTLAVLDTLWPDVLVADLGMPGSDGYVLVRQVRTVCTSLNRTLPLLAFTASGREEERARALLAGFDAHLNKPVHPAAVVAAASRLISGAA